uniref:CUB domain-containing protein n=1 Tax=Steinernema glaseri TaxID=37863 RepID=A0A1I7ZZ68_9BILA
MQRGFFWLLVLSEAVGTPFCFPRSFDLRELRAFALSSDQFQSAELDAACRFHVSAPRGVLVVVRNFFLFSHRRPKTSREIVVSDAKGHFFTSQRLRLEQRLFESDVDVDMPTNLNFRATVVLTEAVNCSRTEDSSWRDCGDGICVPSSVFCDGVENCARGEDEALCKEPSARSHHQETSLSVAYRPFSSSLYMLIGFFLLNAVFVAFFLVLAVCSLGFCYASVFYQSQSKRSRRTFVRYLRSATTEADKEATLHDVPEDLVVEVPRSPFPLPPASPRQRSIISRLHFQPEKTLEELEPENEERDSDFQFERTFSIPPPSISRKQSAPEHFFASKKNSLHLARPTLSTRRSYCSVMFNH